LFEHRTTIDGPNQFKRELYLISNYTSLVDFEVTTTMSVLLAPSPLAQKSVDVLAKTSPDILTILLLLGYIGMVVETTPSQFPFDVVLVGQRWKILAAPLRWDLNRVHVWAALALVREEYGREVEFPCHVSSFM
jgi:hypothetical protein